MSRWLTNAVQWARFANITIYDGRREALLLKGFTKEMVTQFTWFVKYDGHLFNHWSLDIVVFGSVTDAALGKESDEEAAEGTSTQGLKFYLK
jgi:hypothetical protein